MSIIDKLAALEKAATPGPWVVYRCEFAADSPLDADAACGYIDDQSLDASRDECHHTLCRADARLIVAVRNRLPAILAVCKAADAQSAADDELYEKAPPCNIMVLLAARGAASCDLRLALDALRAIDGAGGAK